MSAGGWAAAARIDGDVPGTGDSEGGSWVLAIRPIRAPGATLSDSHQGPGWRLRVGPIRRPRRPCDGGQRPLRPAGAVYRRARRPHVLLDLRDGPRTAPESALDALVIGTLHPHRLPVRAPHALDRHLTSRPGLLDQLRRWRPEARRVPGIPSVGASVRARDNRTDDRPLSGGSPGDGAGAPIRL